MKFCRVRETYATRDGSMKATRTVRLTAMINDTSELQRPASESSTYRVCHGDPRLIKDFGQWRLLYKMRRYALHLTT
jgi:hypothetical protein